MKIKNCPLCNSNGLIDITWGQETYCEVRCSNVLCGIAGPTRKLAEDAIKLWNARARGKAMPKVWKQELKECKEEFERQFDKDLEDLKFKYTLITSHK